jgi:hypothetical protein
VDASFEELRNNPMTVVYEALDFDKRVMALSAHTQ